MLMNEIPELKPIIHKQVLKEIFIKNQQKQLIMYASIKNETKRNFVTLRNFIKYYSDKYDTHKKFPCERVLFYLV